MREGKDHRIDLDYLKKALKAKKDGGKTLNVGTLFVLNVRNADSIMKTFKVGMYFVDSDYTMTVHPYVKDFQGPVGKTFWNEIQDLKQEIRLLVAEFKVLKAALVQLDIDSVE